MILHRREFASWGFSIVGGADVSTGGGVANGVNGAGSASVGGGSVGGSGRPTEPIHVLFVVPESPAAKDAKLRYVPHLPIISQLPGGLAWPRGLDSRHEAILNSPLPLAGENIIDWTETKRMFLRCLVLLASGDLRIQGV